MRAMSLACAMVLATASVARAQDPAKVDAGHYRVLIDNARTRVFRVTVGPGEKVPMHEHPDAIMIPLTLPPTPDGAPAPAAIFMSAQRHGGDNPGATPVDFIYVELKGDAAPTAVVPSNRPGITSARLVETRRQTRVARRRPPGSASRQGRRTTTIR